MQDETCTMDLIATARGILTVLSRCFAVVTLKNNYQMVLCNYTKDKIIKISIIISKKHMRVRNHPRVGTTTHKQGIMTSLIGRRNE